MNSFRIVPNIMYASNWTEYFKNKGLGAKDLIITGKRTYNAFLKSFDKGATVLFVSDFGQGEPTDLMVEAMLQKIEGQSYERVYGIGGGTVMDVAKLFALETIRPVADLFIGKIQPKKAKTLFLIPTTCGTGSEVTNISILELKSMHTKRGLAVDEIFADEAVLIPELLSTLPYEVFATSSLDALIHGIESFLSPKATAFSKMYSETAIRIILNGYKQIIEKGKQDIPMDTFLTASTYAGIAFGNAGCAAVHAMSYPLGAAHHVPHGESNFAILSAVLKKYNQKGGNESLIALAGIIDSIIDCDNMDVFDALERFLSGIWQKKRLRDYGVKPSEIDIFTHIVMHEQGRLMANNYCELLDEDVKEIYEVIY